MPMLQRRIVLYIELHHVSFPLSRSLSASLSLSLSVLTRVSAATALLHLQRQSSLCRQHREFGMQKCVYSSSVGIGT